MRGTIIALTGLITSAFVSPARSASPVLHGTINVVIANHTEAVVLTDSRITEITTDARGNKTERRILDPRQKLFLLDDRTVCTFAGFASADTPALPDFLHRVPSIMGRVKEKLTRADHALTVQEKLQVLSTIFRYYISGVATLRENLGDDYTFEMLIAGYDPDGSLRIGKLKLGLETISTRAGSTFEVVPEEQTVHPPKRNEMLFAGIEDVAKDIEDHPARWKEYEEVSRYSLSEDKKSALTIADMKSLATFMKDQTAANYKEVGGPSQIAVLSEGRVQLPIEQPKFPPIDPIKFKFLIVSGEDAKGETPEGIADYYGITAPGCYPLFFDNLFTEVRQELGDAYYSGNKFFRSALSYQGGRLGFESNNQVIDSDLLIGPQVRSDSPEVRQLLNNFRWRHVSHGGFSTKPSAGMFFGCFDTKDM